MTKGEGELTPEGVNPKAVLPAYEEAQAGMTPEKILKSVVSRFNELDKEADLAISRKEPNIHRQKLVERAELVASLPGKIRDALERGESFPEEELEELENFAELARQRLKDGGVFGLGLLLKPMGGPRIGEPNLLDEFVNRLYPSNKED